MGREERDPSPSRLNTKKNLSCNVAIDFLEVDPGHWDMSRFKKLRNNPKCQSSNVHLFHLSLIKADHLQTSTGRSQWSVWGLAEDGMLMVFQ